jgi:simple sugar transport system permease protein
MKAGLWNLGTVGQVYLGGLGAIVVALYVPRSVPGALVVVLAVLSAFAFGAIWAVVPAVLKAYKGVTEIITTLLMTFLGQDLISYLVDRPPLGLTGAGYPTTATIIPARQLPTFGQATRMNVGLIIAVAVTAMVVLIVARTLYGFQLRAFGLSTSTARSVGLASPRRTVQVLMLSGGIAGIGGAVEILGNGYALTSGFTSVDGFAAVAVALLGAGGGLQLGLATLFFAGLDSAAPTLKLTMGVPASIVSVTEGLVVVMLVVGLGLAGRLAIRSADGSRRRLRGGGAVDLGPADQQLPAAVIPEEPERRVEV